MKAKATNQKTYQLLQANRMLAPSAGQEKSLLSMAIQFLSSFFLDAYLERKKKSEPKWEALSTWNGWEHK